MFIASLFYGYLAEKVGKERRSEKSAFKPFVKSRWLSLLRWNLRAVLDVLLEKIDVFLPYAVVTLPW